MSMTAPRGKHGMALFGLALFVIGSVPAFSQSEGPADILGLELRKEDGQLRLHFVLSAPPKFELVDNLPRRVVVVKFRNARTAFPGAQEQFLFNDPMVEGVAFETVGPDATWAKIRLRGANLAFQVVEPPNPNQMVLGFRVAPPSRTIGLGQVVLRQEPGVTRVVLSVARLPRYESQQSGSNYVVRLIGVTPRLRTPLKGSDDRLSLVSLEQEGEDTLLRIQLKQENLRTSPLLLTDPPRLVFVFRDPEAVTEAPAVAPEKPELPLVKRDDPIEDLLQDEPQSLIRATYTLAEREFRAGHLAASRRNFMRVYNATPTSKLGVRALFRAADAQYARLRRQDAKNYHGVIINYRSAIRVANGVGYDTAQIPHAFFRIARSYQHMNFHNEANIHFRILQEKFTEDTLYTSDSYFYQGQSFLRTGKYKESIEALNEFIERDGDPELIPATYYGIGDALYNLKRFTEAKREFERGRKLDRDFPIEHPVLLFRMGETYYENADFDIARSLYGELLDRYPSKPYTKLVGLRLGDFLREEGKESDALRIYRQVVEQAPLEIRLRGKLRIANIFANRPVGDDFKKALKEYEEVIIEGKTSPVVREAIMRKALTHTMHNQPREAISTFQLLSKKFPKSRYVRQKIVEINVLENLKSLVDTLFANKEYWEVVKVYTKYRNPYFRDFRFNFTLFQVARSYHFLGLHGEALRLYNAIGERNPAALNSIVDYQRALAYSDKDDLGKAEEALLKYIKTYPEGRYVTDARMQLGKVYFEGRRYQDALDAYRIIQQEFEKTGGVNLREALSEVFYQLGNIHKELGQLKDSVDAFRAVLDNYHHPLQGGNVPDHIVLSQFAVGDVLFDLGQDQEAIAAYEQAMARYPEHSKSPWARFQIGLIHRRNGRERKALGIFNELVELAKSRPGELWETLAKENQRDLVNSLGFQDYLKQ
ncbi:MAG: tetratricopeptide repeat protein [SAR324 cluster bacterium]|nr:tetratricopeptide repeat protein [SAR324 cluster bacterium]